MGKGNLKVIFSDNCLRRKTALKECQARPTPSNHTHTLYFLPPVYFQRLAQCLAQVDAHKFNKSTILALRKMKKGTLHCRQSQNNGIYLMVLHAIPIWEGYDSSRGRQWKEQVPLRPGILMLHSLHPPPLAIPASSQPGVCGEHDCGHCATG